MLAGIVYFSWVLNQLWFEAYDPFKQIFHMNVESTIGWFIIAAFVVISLVIERAWCRFLCPLGAFAGLISRFSIFQIERSNSCINCNKCDHECPMGIAVSKITRMKDTRCIKCLDCVSVCPVKSLEIRSGVAGIYSKIKPITLVLLSIMFLTCTVGMAQISGFWNAKNPTIKTVSQITNPNEIKGWMKWSEVISTFKINEKQLNIELGLSENINGNKTVKEVRKEFDISEEKLRQAIEKSKN
jgi:Fe-S-cluster-containing hydrogenase component 2